MIKKQLLALTLVTAVWFGAQSPAFSATGFFGNGFIVLKSNLTQNGLVANTNVFFDLNPSTATGNPDFNGTNLGTFDLSTDSLTIAGGEFNTFQDGGDNVSVVTLRYRIFNAGNPAFLGDPIGFVSQTGNDKFWQSTGDTIDALAALTPGTYNFEVYADATTTAGDQFYNNGGANYTATLTVVPEPSSVALLLGSSVLGGFYLLRRKRA